MNQYTPSNRPPYPWVSVEDELPQPEELLLCVFEHKQGGYVIGVANLYCGEFVAINCQELNNGNWSVPHWQYLPALPE